VLGSCGEIFGAVHGPAQILGRRQDGSLLRLDADQIFNWLQGGGQLLFGAVLGVVS